jgi:hypothetical protein
VWGPECDPQHQKKNRKKKILLLLLLLLLFSADTVCLCSLKAAIEAT